MQKAIVIKSTGSWYQVKFEDNATMKCRIKGKFRLNGMKVTNPVAVGDLVMVEDEKIAGENTGIIKEILPRQNYVVRQSPRQKHNLHLLASNVDQAAVIVTIVNPMLKQGFIDRFLLMTEPHDIPTLIIFNKADLYSEADLEVFDILKEIYEKIGYTILLTSSVTKQGIEELKTFLHDKITLVGGQSGVGKSTLVNTLSPQLNLRTEELSDYSGKGQHTTTFAEMFDLDFGSIIDTPGIKTLAFNNLEVMDVAHNFREFFAISPDCKFGDCTHRNEPKCAVKEALEADEVSELRYFNYINILEEIEDQNYWERHTDM